MHWDKISHLSLEEIKELQNKKLREFIKYQIPYHPFYRRLFKEKNLSFSDIQTTDDLEKLPFTTKQDITPTKEDRSKPRNFILQPTETLIKKYAPKSFLLKLALAKIIGIDIKRKLEEEYKPIHVHFTTGRTALPTPFTYSAYDIDLLKESGERMLNVAGASRDLSALNVFPYAPHLAFWLSFFALTKLGMTSLQTGGGKIMGTQKIIEAIEKTRAGVILGIPGYIYHLLRVAYEQKRDFSSIKFIVFGGERVNPGLREKVREFLEAMGASDFKILTTYAFTEGKTAWIQCSEESGYHLYPDLEFFEIVNKEGKRVKEGEKGELVYTALDWRGTVVLRYKTGDIAEGIEYGTCPYCGRTVPRIKPVITRSSDIKEFYLTKVKGELVDLNAFYPLISSFKEVIEWQVEIRKRNNDPFEVDEIIIWIAPKKEVDFEKLKSRLIGAVRSELFLTPIIEKISLEEITQRLGMEEELKEKRIIDKRPC